MVAFDRRTNCDWLAKYGNDSCQVAGMDRDAWCKLFSLAWIDHDSAADPVFVHMIAVRRYDHEGLRLEPEVAAREHFELLRRIRLATLRP